MEASIDNNKFDGSGLIWAVLASVSLHIFGAIFIPNIDFTQPVDKPPVLHIELMQPAPPPAPVIAPLPPVEIPEPPKPEPPKPEPVKKKPKPIAKPKPEPVKKEEPAPIEEPEYVPPPAPEKVIAVQPSVEREPELVVPQPPPPPIEPPPPSQADLDNALARYGSILGNAIAQHKSYPKIAQRRGWEGIVLLTLKLDSNGRVLSALVRESSGYDALDERALEMVKKAAPFPAPPKIFEGQTLNITVPVSFKLTHG